MTRKRRPTDISLLRLSKGLRQIDVAAACRPPISPQRVHQLEHSRTLSAGQRDRLVAAILAASR